MSEPFMQCAMTGIPIRDCGDGIYDDGEWISWAYINRRIAIQEGELVKELPEIFTAELQWLIMEAEYDEAHGIVPSPKWGRIGELYAANRFGITLSRAYSQGHDGHLGKDLVEIKTLTPHKHRPVVRVKRRGNFSLLAVVRVHEDHFFEALLVRRVRLPMSGEGDYLFIDWNTLCRLAESLE